MEIRECKSEDIIEFLLCARDNKETEMFDTWAQHQKWLLDAIYNKNWNVLVAVDDVGVVGYLVSQLYQVYFKWEACLHHVYVNPDFRKTDVSDKLVWGFIHNVYNSSAQRCKFNTKVLPQKWVDTITLMVPYDKYETYYIPRTDELKRWYNESIQ